MPQIGGIEFEERNGSGVFELNRAIGLTGTRIYTVDWSDMLTFIKALVQVDWIKVGPYLFQAWAVNPWTLDDGSVLGCDTVSVQGLGQSDIDANDSIVYDRARVVAKYIPVSHVLGDNTDELETGSVNIDFSGEFFTMPKGAYKYHDTGHVINEPLGKLMCYQEVTVLMKGLQHLPRTGIRATMGNVNNAPWQGAGTGCVLFLGGSSRQIFTTEGAKPYDVTMKFKERPIDWNYVLGKDAQWHLVVDTDSGTEYPYDYVNFADLLKV